MKRVHSIHAAKPNLSRLIEQASAGDEVIIARGAEPVARLVPIRANPVRRRFGTMRGRARVTDAFFEPLPREELDARERQVRLLQVFDGYGVNRIWPTSRGSGLVAHVEDA
jgi:prevent-host-death family protein